jgi:curved DNA-binding protein CbpA
MTTKPPDPYAVLGVPPDATQAEISHAYRAMLRRHHPDTRSPGDDAHLAVSDATLQHVLAAYAVLHDPARRADYDREAAPRIPPARRQAQRAPDRHGTSDQPPIVAGPVRWHLVDPGTAGTAAP